MTDELMADNTRLREALEQIKHPVEFWISCNTEFSDAYKALLKMIDTAIATTPAQSLTRLRNEVREECKQICLKEWSDDLGKLIAGRCADSIEALKEPEE